MMGQSSQKSRSKFIPGVHALRGLAALWVCYFHLGSGYLPEGHWLHYFCSPGHFGVQIFFVISGFILPYSLYHKRYELPQYARFLSRRLIRLEPPYLASIALIFGLVFLSWLSPYLSEKAFILDWSQFFSHLAYLVPFTGETWYNPVYWTLGVEFQFYVLIGLAFPLLIHHQKGYRYAVLIGFAVLHYLFPHFYLVFNHAVFFLTGMILFLFWKGLFSFREMAFSLLWVFALMVFQWSWSEVWVSTLALLFISCWQLEWKSLRFLGKISYSLYLIHVPVAVSFVANFLLNFGFWKSHPVALIHLALASALFSAWVFCLLIEEPSKKWAQKLNINKHETIS